MVAIEDTGRTEAVLSAFEGTLLRLPVGGSTRRCPQHLMGVSRSTGSVHGLISTERTKVSIHFWFDGQAAPWRRSRPNG